MSTSSDADKVTLSVLDDYLRVRDDTSLDWSVRLNSCLETLTSNRLPQGVPGRVLSELSSPKLVQLATMLPPVKARPFTQAALDSDAAIKSSLLRELMIFGIGFDDSPQTLLATTKARFGLLGLSFIISRLVVCFSFHGSFAQLPNHSSGCPHIWLSNKLGRLEPSL
jgi:hypothetical protein